MNKIYFTSDLHLCHNRDFVYGARGFDNVEDMNKVIIDNINKIVNKDDELYILGDLMLNDTDEGIRLMNQIKCQNIHIILGNHDNVDRVERYKKEIFNIVSIDNALMIRYNKILIYLSHYPSITRTLDDSPNKMGILNFYGHTHQETNFYNDNPYMYHVGLDSHELKPVLIDDALIEIFAKLKESKHENKD